MTSPLPKPMIDDLVNRALREDLGDAGDITTNATIPATAIISGTIRARKPGWIAGTDIAISTFAHIDPSISVDVKTKDGTKAAKDDPIITVRGSARAILTAERVALNFLGHLSGIATATATLVSETKGTIAKISCTRKTTPGLRAIEKYAVQCGGGHNHRFGLYDAVMIKDNHIAAVGDVKGAIDAARRNVGHMVKIEVEIDRLDQLAQALTGGADVILLDNMPPEILRKAVQQTGGRAILEASGNVTQQTVRAIAETGVDVISSGWITHSAPTLDLGLDFDEQPS